MNVCLVLKKKGGARKPFTLPDSVTVIGRRQECDLCIPLMVVSRRHCQINLDEGKLRIRDLGSRNGTYVNGQRIEETELSPGDEIRIGPLQFSVRIDGVPADDSDILSPPAHIAEAEQGTSAVQEVGAAAAAQDKDDPFADLDDLDDLDDLINLDDMDSAIDTMRDSMGDVSQKAQEDEQRPI